VSAPARRQILVVCHANTSRSIIAEKVLLRMLAERGCRLTVVPAQMPAGDALALRAVEREAFYLGLGLANLENLFTPDAVILSGSVMKSASLFFDGIGKVMRQGCRFVPLEKAELKKPARVARSGEGK